MEPTLVQRIQEILKAAGGRVTFVAVVTASGPVETGLVFEDNTPYPDGLLLLADTLREFAGLLEVAVEETKV